MFGGEPSPNINRPYAQQRWIQWPKRSLTLTVTLRRTVAS